MKENKKECDKSMKGMYKVKDEKIIKNLKNLFINYLYTIFNKEKNHLIKLDVYDMKATGGIMLDVAIKDRDDFLNFELIFDYFYFNLCDVSVIIDVYVLTGTEKNDLDTLFKVEKLRYDIFNNEHKGICGEFLTELDKLNIKFNGGGSKVC